MKNQLFSALCLVTAWLHPRINPQLLFLKAQLLIFNKVLNRHGIQYVVLEPEEKEELLRLGEALNHNVKDLFFINTMGTYRKWRRTKQQGGKLKKPRFKSRRNDYGRVK